MRATILGCGILLVLSALCVVLHTLFGPDWAFNAFLLWMFILAGFVTGKGIDLNKEDIDDR